MSQSGMVSERLRFIYKELNVSALVSIQECGQGLAC